MIALGHRRLSVDASRPTDFPNGRSVGFFVTMVFKDTAQVPAEARWRFVPAPSDGTIGVLSERNTQDIPENQVVDLGKKLWHLPL